MASRQTRRLVLVMVLVGTLFTLVGSQAAVARGPAKAAAFSATLSCRDDGGADVTLTIRNVGHQTLNIQDIHLELLVVRDGQPESAGVLFIFPAPSHAGIPPGEERTFTQLTFGEQFDPSEPRADLSGDALILAVDVYLVRQSKPISGELTFPACNG